MAIKSWSPHGSADIVGLWTGLRVRAAPLGDIPRPNADAPQEESAGQAGAGEVSTMFRQTAWPIPDNVRNLCRAWRAHSGAWPAIPSAQRQGLVQAARASAFIKLSMACEVTKLPGWRAQDGRDTRQEAHASGVFPRASVRKAISTVGSADGPEGDTPLPPGRAAPGVFKKRKA